MALELTTLLAAIATTRKIVDEGKQLVGSLPDGVGRRRKKLRSELQSKLDVLSERLQDVGKVAEAAETYFRTLENVGILLSTCRRLQQFMSDNEKELEDWRSSGYGSGWAIVTTLYQQLDDDSTAVRKVLLNRSEWYGERDKDQIEGKLVDFSNAFNRAKGSVESKRKERAWSELENMLRPLIEAEVLLSDTLYQQILAKLQTLKA